MTKLPLIKRTIFFNTSYQLLGKALSLAIVFVSTLLLRRYFGRSGYGDYVFIFSYITVFNTWADFGTRYATIPEASRKKNGQDEALSISLTSRLCLVLLAVVLYWLGVLFFPFTGPIRLTLLAGSGLLLVFFLRDSLYMVFTVKLKLQYYVLVELGVGALMLLAAAATVQQQQGLLFLYLSMVVLPMVFLTIFWTANRFTKPLRLIFSLAKMKKIYRKSSYIFGAMLLFTVSSQTPQLVLKVVKTSESLGILGLSYKIYENGLLPAALTMNVCLPIIAQLSRQPKKNSRRFLQNNFDMIVLLGLAVSVGMYLLAPLGVRILTGSFLEPEIKTVRALSIVLLVAYLNHFYGFLMLGTNLLKELMLSKLVGLLIGGLILWPLLSLFSYLGAVIFYLLTELLVLLYSIVICYQKLNFLPVATRFFKTFGLLVKSRGKVLIK